MASTAEHRELFGTFTVGFEDSPAYLAPFTIAVSGTLKALANLKGLCFSRTTLAHRLEERFSDRSNVYTTIRTAN
jgi:hypothetical protein